MRPCAARSPGLTRTSYSVLGARTMHVMLDRREVAERRGAGHVARCTACTAHGRLGPAMVSGAPNRRTLRARLLEDQCPADLVRRHFEAFAPGGLWVADIPPQAGGAPSYVRAFSGWVYVAFVTDVYSRRIIGWQTTYRPVRTDLATGALRMAIWQRRREGADLTGLVHHLRSWGAVQVPSATGRLWPSARRSPRWVPRGTPTTMLWPRR